MREFIIRKNDAGQRLDKFLTKALDIPQSLLYKSIRTKKIKLNRKRADAAAKLSEGDSIQCFLADEFFKKGRKKGFSEGSELPAESLGRIRAQLDIIYEDENIILVNKPRGLSVHEDESTKSNTLITYIQSYLFAKDEYNPDAEMSFAPALCNRIDKNTTGIVIAAKNAAALRVMNEKIKLREIRKFYLAEVHGVPLERKKTLVGYLLKNEKTNTVRVYDDSAPRGAKKIVTKYRVLAESGDTSLVEVELMTGRTHQIRAHMAHIGHALVGDGKYGNNKSDRAAGYSSQALCSYKLIFDFSAESCELDYLRGKEFSIPTEKIPFTSKYIK